MNTNDVQAIKRLLADRKSRYATVAFVDLQGQLRGKTLSAQKLPGIVKAGVPFAPFNQVLDFGDHRLMPRGYLSADIGVEDNCCRLVTATPRTLPFEDKDSDLFFFVEFEEGTRGHEWDPRIAYARAERRLAALGLSPMQAFEYEFRLFKETPASARAKGYRNLDLLCETSTYGGIMRQGVHADFFRELRNMCNAMDLTIASMHWEVDASLAELAIAHRRGIAAADDAALFKTHAKVLAQRHDMLLSFMARPLAHGDGQSGHVHLSVLDANGANAFHDPQAPHGMSTTMRHFVGGLESLMPELLLLFAPNVNSFKRFVPGIFAPIAATWGIDNRTCAIRAIPGDTDSQRLECRVAGSDTNPYLVLAGILAAGAWGIEHAAEPSEPIVGSSYLRADEVPQERRFPNDLTEAVKRFRTSRLAREVFGDDFVEMFAGTREAQAREFARMVTDKELERFLELA